jgi:hypothetical protein
VVFLDIVFKRILNCRPHRFIHQCRYLTYLADQGNADGHLKATAPVLLQFGSMLLRFS